jgi:hypothetical protein
MALLFARGDGSRSGGAHAPSVVHSHPAECTRGAPFECSCQVNRAASSSIATRLSCLARGAEIFFEEVEPCIDARHLNAHSLAATSVLTLLFNASIHAVAQAGFGMLFVGVHTSESTSEFNLP